MTVQNSSGTLVAAVAPEESFDAPYPAGTAHSDYVGGREHAIAIGQNVYYSPNDIGITFSADGVTVTNHTASAWPVGENYVLSLDKPGMGGMVSNGGQPMARVQSWPVVYLNLGSPVAEDEEGLRVGAPIAVNGDVALLIRKFDVPRNITFHSDADESGLIFTVLSTDEYGQQVYEEIDGAVHGRKAHLHNISVHASGASAGAVQIGWGPEIGLPCFVPSMAVVLKELQDGVEVVTPGVIFPGDETEPSATSGDVRGTYESEVTPDGNRSFGLLCCMPDPGYLGADQFAG